jgi:hypothetical protein
MLDTVQPKAPATNGCAGPTEAGFWTTPGSAKPVKAGWAGLDACYDPIRVSVPVPQYHAPFKRDQTL